MLQFILSLAWHELELEFFFKFQLGNQFREKKSNNPNTTQICFETFNWFKVNLQFILSLVWHEPELGIFKIPIEKKPICRKNQNKPNTTQICFETYNSF